jgi:catechol 2,3-dioxygenase-like lactoylglutathione lyase family enzyme
MTSDQNVGSGSIKTYGLTHVALAAREPRRSAAFYCAVFGCEPVYESDDFVQIQTPGARDVIVFERAADVAGAPGGVAHIGFRLQDARDIDAAADAVIAAGGRVIDKGEFCPGEPYLFAEDLDGYAFEIWYELPTRLDPPDAAA